MRTHPKVNKDPEEMSHVRDLNLLSDALLLIKEDTHTLSLGVYISALLLSSINCVSVCCPTCAVALIINSVPVFTAFVALRNSFFSEGTSRANFASSPSS